MALEEWKFGMTYEIRRKKAGKSRKEPERAGNRTMA